RGGGARPRDRPVVLRPMERLMDARVITSLTNPTVKAVRALHMRKARDETGLFLAQGLKCIGEALVQGRAPKTLLIGKDARPPPLLERARRETLAARGPAIERTLESP